MWNAPTKKQLSKIPAFYSTEDIATENKQIYMHFFIGGCDWWIAEYDPESECFFGFANLNDPQNAEWGYVALNDLKELNISGIEVDRDKFWQVRPVKEIQPMCKIMNLHQYINDNQ